MSITKVSYSMIEGACKNVLDFGADPTGVNDSSSAIQAALNLAGRVYIPQGAYKCLTTLVVKNRTFLFGDGNTTQQAATIISYQGADDAIQINNLINSSTAAFITLTDFCVVSSNTTPTKACIADTGSTFLHIERVTVQGGWCGIIFDQTEVSFISQCNFEGNDTIGLWMVNNADHVPGAAGFYTNQICVSECQFNRASAAGTFAVVDDGGANHEYKNCNFNAWGGWMRFSAQSNTKVTNSEFEGALISSPILFSPNSFYSGTPTAGGTTCTFDTNTIGNSAVQNAIEILPGNTHNTLTLISNAFGNQTLPNVKGSNYLGALNLIGNYPNTQMLRETTAPEILFEYLVGDWTPNNGEVTIVVNTAKYVKIGRQVTVSFDVTWPATANASSSYIYGLPYALAANSPCSGVVGSSTGANAQFLFADPPTQVVYINRNSTTGNANADLSTYRMKGSITYITSQ